MECWREGEHSSLLGTWFLERRAGQWFFSSQSCVQKEARGWCGLDVRLLYLCEDRQLHRDVYGARVMESWSSLGWRDL